MLHWRPFRTHLELLTYFYLFVSFRLACAKPTSFACNTLGADSPLCQTNRSGTSTINPGKWNDIFQSNRANPEEWLLQFLIPFPNSLHKWNLLKRSWAMNRFVKMEHISVRPTQPIKVGHPQRWSRIFRSDGTLTDLSIRLPTEITDQNFWHYGTGSTPGEMTI